MVGVWKLNPFYWVALRRLSRTNQSAQSQQGLSLAPKTLKFSQFWALRPIRVLTVGVFAIILPLYAYVRMQPASSIEIGDRTMLEIPEIGLSTPVAAIEMVNRQLIAPDTIAGVYSQNENKLFIIGHSSTVFENLHQTTLGSNFSYDGNNYVVTRIDLQAKSDIDMNAILAPSSEETIILMTCAGDPLPNQDATHRLIITAVREPILDELSN